MQEAEGMWSEPTVQVSTALWQAFAQLQVLAVRGVSTAGHCFVATVLIPSVPRRLPLSTVETLREAAAATGRHTLRHN